MSIFINVVNQKMYISSTVDGFVAGSQNFVKFQFNLSEEWDGLKTFAQFKQGSLAYNRYLDEQNSVYLPSEIREGTCTLTLYGSQDETVGTSNYIELKIAKNILVSNASDGGAVDTSGSTVAVIGAVLYNSAQTLNATARTTARNNIGIYTGPDEPTDAQEGDVWFDTDDTDDGDGTEETPVTGSVELDDTLTVSGKAADAKAVGDRIGVLSSLTTTDQSSLVAAINEVNALIGDIGAILDEINGEVV